VRPLARLLLVLGMAAIGLFVFRQAPRQVTLVYGVPEPASARELDVEIRRAGATVRHAEFRFPGGAPAQVRHEVRLPDGDYTLGLRLSSDGEAPRVVVVTRSIEVSEEGPIFVSLAGAP